MTKVNLIKSLEALLFVASEPLKLSQLAHTLEAAEEDIANALDTLKEKLKTSGLRLMQSDNSYQLVTAPDLAPMIERFLGNQVRNDLSRPALETLAIIVYRQPVTKMQIDEVRGISSDQTIRNLLLRDLIAEAGYSNEPGKPVLYRPSHRLLHHLGLTSFDELTSFENLSESSNED
jgi:segregation and condensation protein B